MEAATANIARPEPTARVESRVYVAYLEFSLCAALYLLPFMRLLLQGTDEGTLAYGAVRIIHGEVFARDFFEVIGPGTFYWLAMFFKIFGATFVAERICLFITSLATGVAIYFLSRAICERYRTLPCILLAGTYFGMLWPTVSHHVDSNCFALLSVTCLVAWLRRRETWLLFFAGGLAGATTCFLQPKGLLLFLAIDFWLYIQRRRAPQLLRNLAAVSIGYLIVPSLAAFYFWSQHALPSLIYANLVWPSANYSVVNVVPYAQGLLRDHWESFRPVAGGFRWLTPIAAMVTLPFAMIAALPALLPLFWMSSAKQFDRQEISLFWLCGWALWLSEVHRRDIGHLVFGCPLLIILSVYYLERYRIKLADLVLQMLVVSAALLCCFNLFLALSARAMKTRVGTVAAFRSEPLLSVLLEKVQPGEEIFAYPYCPMYYFLSATVNPTRYSFLMYNYNTAAQFEEVVSTLEKRKTKYVVAMDSGAEQTMLQTLFPSAAGVSPNQLIVEPYLKSHYSLVKDDGNFRILQRNSSDIKR